MARISKKRNLIYVIILLSIGSIIGIYLMDEYVDKLNEEYSINIKGSGKIHSKVIKIIPWHGVTNIVLSNSEKYWIEPSRNYNLDNIFIDDNINVGDSIIKKADSDSLWIISSKGKFVFVVGEWINKPVK